MRASGRKVDLKPARGAGIARLGMEEFRFQKRLCNENSTTCSLFVLISFDFAQVTYLVHGAVLLGKLTALQLVKKFPAFYGTQRLIAVFTSARHLSLS